MNTKYKITGKVKELLTILKIFMYKGGRVIGHVHKIRAYHSGKKG
jgi:hypothetical protein